MLWGGGIEKLCLYASNCFIGLFAFICILFTFINFYYYQTYQSNITSFIFALKDNDRQINRKKKSAFKKTKRIIYEAI